jgi:putative Holliday junction resolvase
LGISVRPLETIRRTTRERDFTRIKEIIEEQQAKAVVVGLPLRMDGAQGDAARTALRFADTLRKKLGVQVVTQDERLTSYEAESIMAELGFDRKRRRERSDEFAAMIILRDYLAASAASRE